MIKFTKDKTPHVEKSRLIGKIRDFVQFYYYFVLIKRSGLYNRSYYLQHNPDIKEAGANPFKHYLWHGGFEGRNPGNLFDSQFYLTRYPDVAASGINPLLHYLLFGKKEERSIKQDVPGHATDHTYTNWVKRYDTLSKNDISLYRKVIENFQITPLISVVMPVYNPNPAWLKAAIESVINQVYPRWELCIADDCSTVAEIGAILRSYKKKDPRIKVVFRESNGHISETSNSAIAIATGDYKIGRAHV